MSAKAKKDPNTNTLIHWILVMVAILLYVHWATAPDDTPPPNPNVPTIPAPQETPRGN